MHRNSVKLMQYFRDKYLKDMKGSSVLDVGSRFVRRSYRHLFVDYDYVGMDIRRGKNVDIVGYENIPGEFDIVISGQVMEHVKRPWDWLKSLKKYYRTYICIIAPNTWIEHKSPYDTYRYFPDGMRDLFEYADIKEIEIFKDGNDTVGIGGKHG